MKTNSVRLLSILVLIALSSCSQFLPLPVQDPATDAPASISQPEATSTKVPPTDEPTLIPTPTEEPTLTPTPTDEPTLIPTPTIHGVVNPTGVIPAGMPAIVDGYVLIAEKSDMYVEGDFVSFELKLRIIGNEAKLFRYNVFSIRLRDDLGNYYDYNYGNNYNKCPESSIYNPKQYMINPETDLTISYYTPEQWGFYDWCEDGKDTLIPGFSAMVPPGAKSLILEFEAFGPFSGFGFEFDL